jgi:hypothetical protein
VIRATASGNAQRWIHEDDFREVMSTGTRRICSISWNRVVLRVVEKGTSGGGTCPNCEDLLELRLARRTNSKLASAGCTTRHGHEGSEQDTKPISTCEVATEYPDSSSSFSTLLSTCITSLTNACSSLHTAYPLVSARRRPFLDLVTPF